MKRHIFTFSIIGWGACAVLVVMAVTGTRLTGLVDRASSPASAAPGHLTGERALRLAESAAADYVRVTLGSEHSTGGSISPAINGPDGAPLRLAAMERVDFRFVANTRQVATSITSGVSFEEEKDFWVASWELGGVYNVTSGQPDGTAAVVVVVEDGTGKLLAAGAEVRQPDVQARAREPLPAFEELFPALPAAQ